MIIKIDIVTVFHNQRYKEMADEMSESLFFHEKGNVSFTLVDNQISNRGFSAACNLGAKEGVAPVLGFINPDAIIEGPFVDQVFDTLNDNIIITGHRFGKPDREVRIWGLQDWVCGAAFFVQRNWFESVGGFDERYSFCFEESDLIKQAEAEGKRCKSIHLPIRHESPDYNTPEDAAFKNYWFDKGARVYAEKWGR